jgi:hypothetical protein
LISSRAGDCDVAISSSGVSVLAGGLIFLTANAVIRARHANATLSDFAWLAGHLTGPGLAGIAEEIWTGPASGSMQGMYRLARNGKVVFYEILTLTKRTAASRSDSNISALISPVGKKRATRPVSAAEGHTHRSAS